MTPTSNRAIATVLLVSLFVFQASPAVAQFTGTGNQATHWVVQVLTPFFALGVAVAGILSLTGRVNWAWFGAAVIGCGLFFGRDQVVSLIRGFLGV
jgi:type IV secretory pathway VirB2 component (pilin)